MSLETLFRDYIQAGIYLKGWSAKTPLVYQRAFTSFQQSRRELTVPNAASSLDVSNGASETLRKTQLEAWVVSMRTNGRSAAGCNIYIRAMNAFCNWLKEEGRLAETIKLRQLRNHQKVITIFSEAEIRQFLKSKPSRVTYLRTWMLIALMLDTGCRIDEALQLQTKDVDFDNLLITLNGKGGKQRRVPFSADLRKHLWPYCRNVETFVFGTRTATRLSYRNAYRNIKLCFLTAGVKGPHVHPHTLRHTFACNYMRRGGSIFTLSRILGHSSITTTQIYLRGLQVEELQRSTSLLARA